MSSHYNICRLCKKAGWETPREGMFQYAPRHWAHASCGIERWGAAAFLAKLHPHQVKQLPALVLDKYPEALKLAMEIIAQSEPTPEAIAEHMKMRSEGGV